MIIVHLNFAPAYGGGEVQTLNLISWLAEHQIEQCVLARKNSPFAKKVSEELPHIPLLSLPRLFFQLLLRKKKNLVFHAHDGRSLHYAALLKMIFGFRAVATRRVDKGLPSHRLSLLSYRNIDRLVAISTQIEKRLEDDLGSDRCVRIPDSFSDFSHENKAVAEIRERFPGKKLIGQIGSLYTIKGHTFTIQVARKLALERPDLQFVILGEGGERSRLEQQATGLSNLTFIGFVQDVGNWLAALEVLVHPSLREGLGSILLEAQQLGVPVIASDVGGIPDVVIDGETGLLVPAGDSLALQEAILRLVDNQVLRTHLITGAKKRLTKFSPETVGKAYLTLYQGLVDES
ncbi:glycosyltransferase family 4 protein [Geopsychrobacter electrodiphilus]|uniref:glycosyltransferase family 4 protein n=1 Tax=Geopsychrobacter electrodiphilus TaxID=225196 RepID=UPI0003715D1E|nr:glycosyltransferase family 4 protein [Geopsychrobacter electrodiphilus]